MGRINEYNAVQKPTLTYLAQEKAQYGEESYLLGYEIITKHQKDKLNQLRTTKRDAILKKIFFEKVKKLNPFLSDSEIEKLYNEINQLSANILGNKTAWEYLRGLRSIYIEEEKRHRNVKLIDRENIENNHFLVVEEFEFQQDEKTIIRLDIALFINGIPVLFQENKNPQDENALTIGYEQVKRYEREGKDLLKLIQAFVLTNNLWFLYGPTWFSSYKDLYNYREEKVGDFKKLIESFYDKKRIVKLLTDYIFFVEKDGQLQKAVLKPHQIEAVERIAQRAGEEGKLRGLIWHTQGSGKTYTMLVSAKLILEDPRFENPTVLMVVDRNELEQQLFNNLSSAGLNVRRAESKRDLLKLLREDYRGLILTTIHKFDDFPEKLNTRKNIFVFIDEAHRSTGGELGNHLIGALPNATIIGFTGTPRLGGRRNTFLMFGRDDEGKYLHKYGMIDSIKDGTTLPLHYQHAPSEYLVDEKKLEEDLEKLKECYDEEDLARITEKLSSKDILEDPNRIEKIAQYIAEHFRKYVEPLGYKAFVVAVSRKACVLYKKALDKHLPPDYSRVVISQYYNDPEEIKSYYLSKEEERKVREDFKNPEKLPKILIVTDKLLTGYDAPVLYCMYLDKIMRDHMLLQAIARVNRPYEKDGRKKPAGLIVDFVGLFRDLKKALEFDAEDFEEINYALGDIQKLREEFQKMIEELKEYIRKFEDYSPQERAEKIAQFFRENPDKYKEFKENYKRLRDIYDILSPDEITSKYLQDFKKLTEIYRVARSFLEPTEAVDKELSEKIKEILYGHSQFKDHFAQIEEYTIDENLLNLLKSGGIQVYILLESFKNELFKKPDEPYYRDLKRRLETIWQEYNKKQKEPKEVIEELEQLIKDFQKVQQEEATKPKLLVSIHYKLKDFKNFLNDLEKIAQEIYKLIEEEPNWKESKKAQRDLKLKILELLEREIKNYHLAVKIEKQIFEFLAL
ncbi:MAG: type I restriction endonuclease subunit R [Candidatus Hydrothermia bacterium]|jgi:type I restriction enzyme R subunit